MGFKGLQEVLVDQLRDLLGAEKQLMRALPKMVRAAGDEGLREAFSEHLEATRGHVDRLEKAMKGLGIAIRAKQCKAMKGLIEEGSEIIEQKEKSEESPLDAALIAAAQRVEHYEISAYGSARTFAEVLGHRKAAAILQETLDEESAANEKLSKLAETINEAAAHGAEESDEEEGLHAGGRNGRRPSNSRHRSVVSSR